MGIIKDIKSREISGLGDRFNLFFSVFMDRVAGFIPARYRWIVPSLLEPITLPIPEFAEVKQEVINKLMGVETEEAVQAGVKPPPTKSRYTAYRCVYSNPFICEWQEKTLIENPQATHCSQCSFPLRLPPEARILGMRGTYQVEDYFKPRNGGRLYRAIDLSDRSPVVIKEYLLPKRYFSRNETRLRQSNFINFTGIDLADGRHQDIRIISPNDAIAPTGEERCYLITQGTLESFPDLASYLTETGSLSQQQVRIVLTQTLQSLEFLHGQKFRLPNGIVLEGVIHGNISLESLLIVPTFQGFYIYLTDPALWENLFIPSAKNKEEISVEKDLYNLGLVAFYLLAGRSSDPETYRPLDPTFDDYWPPINQQFKHFIVSLMGLTSLNFTSASEARRELLKLPALEEIYRVDKPETETEIEPKKDKKRRKFWLFLGGLLGVSLLILLIWYLLARSRRIRALTETPICCIEQVTGLNAGNYVFSGEQQGIWSYIWLQKNLIAKGTSLEEEFLNRINPPKEGVATPEEDAATNTDDPIVATDTELSETPPEIPEPRYNLLYSPAPTASEAIAKIRNFEADFAVSSLFRKLGIDLWFERFAYDAIAIYVSFSYSERQNSIPEKLQGRITFEQLRRLYTGEISNWKEIGGPDLAVKLYIPDDEEAVTIFEQRVLQDADAIATFRELVKLNVERSAVSTQIIRLSTFKTFNAVIQDFEDRQVGGIAFGSLSKVFGQCSVYPLALGDNKNDPVSPLMMKNGSPITPQTDLCNEKGSYFLNSKAVREQRYPLSYALAVVYPRDNRRMPIGLTFIDVLKTTEAQVLLRKAGLVPLKDAEESQK
ncbi:substrate-binding domain-containing protein [Spirulina sp. 06S082]|uniref:substrate-binding domain-containing protein n=1 Tax=Spirulina sp. 06S082 TaxID=3110248 RepID=UPI002B21EFC9|nr:substrate-binding domain-containing protein [Spirulina sp. 06S082]MEA5468625.1 substrate-binding domain-containing protein [Spirulina sp. 06S082]